MSPRETPPPAYLKLSVLPPLGPQPDRRGFVPNRRCQRGQHFFIQLCHSGLPLIASGAQSRHFRLIGFSTDLGPRWSSGNLPNRKGHKEHAVTGQSLTSSATSQQQSRQWCRTATRGDNFFLAWLRYLAQGFPYLSATVLSPLGCDPKRSQSGRLARA